MVFSSSGSFSNTFNFLKRAQDPTLLSGSYSALAQRGVEALRAATPVESGLTAASWGYEIEEENGRVTITWTNTNTVNGAKVAILLQYGHGTGTGGYVAGRDYINPALKPIFDEIANDMWKKVTSA